MRSTQCSLLTALATATLSAAQVQQPGLTLPDSAKDAKQQVVDLFTGAYGAYKQFAFGHDDLTPVSKSFTDGRNGWGATIVDASSTMKVMGLDDLFNEAVNFTTQIDFSESKTDSTVSLFETTIRYLGGILSAYELNGKQPPALLEKARELGDRLVIGWSKGTAVPYNDLDFSTNQPNIGTTSIAGAGTLTLEFGRLSDLTGNETYRQLAENAVKHIAGLAAPLPGLAAQGVDPGSGDFVGAYVSWGGGSDSYFEYLLKYARMYPDADSVFLNTWRQAVDSSIRYLARTSLNGDHTYLADFNDQRQIVHVGSHLACFHGGNWILGGKLLNNQTIVDYGLRLADACWNTYASTATGIGPEAFGFTSTPLSPNDPSLPPNATDDGSNNGGSAASQSQQSFNDQHGFYILNGGEVYILRPEVLESQFYAWRATGDTKYIQNAMSALNSFQKYLPVPGSDGGVSGISDVNSQSFSRIDDTESFFFAEVMKYLYLIFDDPSHISLDDYVFNTECHPLPAPALPNGWGQTPTMPAPTSAPTPIQHVPLPQFSVVKGVEKQVGQVLGITEGSGSVGDIVDNVVGSL